MSKILKKLAVLVLTGLAVSSFFACQNNVNSSEPDGPIEPEPTATLEVNNDEISLILGEEAYLDVTFEAQEGYELSFSSSDTAIVEVDENGKCSSKNLGEATITVSYSNGDDTLTDTATVVVELGNNIPKLMLIGVSNEKNQIALNSTLNIRSRIAFNGRFFEADDITYTVSNSLGNVVDGIFTPTKTGEGTIEINAEWCEVEALSLTQTIPVSVINDVNLYANEGKTSYELYTLERFGDYTYDTDMPFVVYGYENGSPVTPTVEIISGEEFIEYDVEANTISSKEKSGKAEILISYTDIENKVYNETISIDILPSLADYKGETIEFSALDGDLPLDDIFQETVTLKAAFDENGKVLTVSDNKVFGCEVLFDNNSQPKETTLTVCTDTCGYNISIIPYTKIIDEASDLEIFYLGDGVLPTSDYPYANDCSFKGAAIFDGYYVLKDDIDASTYTHRAVDVFHEFTATESNGKKVVLTTKGETPAQGLTGVFDGRGHTISNIKLTRGGLFGAIVGGTVKNLAITNVSFDTNQITVSGTTTYGSVNDPNVLATFIDGGLAENVYIYVPTMRMTSRNDSVARSALVSSFITDKTVMKNCIFRCDNYTYTKEEVTYDGVDSADKQYGSIMSDCRGTNYQWENVYVICSVPLAKCTINGTYRPNWSADASNQNPDSTKYKTPFIGVYRYDTQSDFEQATDNDYEGFSSTYWDTTSGVPTWK